MALSPMMKQYMEIKKQYEDCILFFRLGDFYEMFFGDAETVSKELDLVLTGKSCGLEERAPMCGVPFHSAETYIASLIEKGYKIAICEQVEDPKETKGIVKREVIRIVTPGTLMSSDMLSENENNYIASLFFGEDSAGFAYCDISTGEMYGTVFKNEDCMESAVNELVKINAKELLINDDYCIENQIKPITDAIDTCIEQMDESYYMYNTCRNAVLKQFCSRNLFDLGIEENSILIQTVGCMLQYLIETQKNSLDHINTISTYETGSHMALDKATIRNLEITETLFEKTEKGSLLGVLDCATTAMGSRTMKKWLKEPLTEKELIQKRLDAVEYFTENYLTRNDIREYLKSIYDFERITARIATGNANARDLIALKKSCENLPDIKAEISNTGIDLLDDINDRISLLSDIYDTIERSIVDEPPFTVREGGLIKEKYSEELDEINLSVKDSRDWITGLEATERDRTGIKNLKVGFNKVFGYYLEVTRSYYELIPENYIRKQTLANAERFITPELKEAENLVLNAETKINKLEYQIFSEIRNFTGEYTREIQVTSSAIAELDVLISFAKTAVENDYVKPNVNEEDKIIIEKGRHPVIEKTIPDGIFVSNDTFLDRNESGLLLITGPNMAGKSTYMRQTALIVLMAQAGCFVPCESAVIGIADRIFTRIGASDNLARGQSTFFVEMNELAYILKSATERSLVILDEIGRGTSTYDGLSIAWATAEYLCDKRRKIRTLFATHYHEMTVLEEKLSCLKNLNVAASEENGSIVFLHKIQEGSASQSYGIEVARLAGVPSTLLEAASVKLEELENVSHSENSTSEKTNEKFSKHIAWNIHKQVPENIPENKHEQGSKQISEQISLFDFVENPVIERLKAIDLMELTPSAAFKILEELKEAAEK